MTPGLYPGESSQGSQDAVQDIQRINSEVSCQEEADYEEWSAWFDGADTDCDATSSMEQIDKLPLCVMTESCQWQNVGTSHAKNSIPKNESDFEVMHIVEKPSNDPSTLYSNP